MTQDAANLLAHLRIERADVMGYSMGARLASFLALSQPSLVRALILGGLGDRLTRDAGLPEAIAEAMEAPSLDSLADPAQRMFRAFAERTKSDRAALAACVRGSRRALTPAEAGRIAQPALVAVGDARHSRWRCAQARRHAAERDGVRHSRPRSQSRGRRQARSRPLRSIFWPAGNEPRASAQSTKVLITKQVTSLAGNVKTAIDGRP